MDTSYKNILLHNRIICKLIYSFLPNELINIIKQFLKPKEWNYLIYITRKHIKAENLNIKNINTTKVFGNENVKKTLKILDYDYNYTYNSKNKKLNRKEYLLSKIKIKYKKQNSKVIVKSYDKKLYLTNDFLKKNQCLKCKKNETPEEPFVDYCSNCFSYIFYYGSYYPISWDDRSLSDYDYDDDTECRYCIRPYSSCRCVYY
jgi:hypothetical protein